jgi:hypothetical protein
MEEGGGVDSGSGGAARRALAPGTPVNGCSSAQLLVSSDEVRRGAAARIRGGRTASSSAGAGKTWLPRGWMSGGSALKLAVGSRFGHGGR